MQGGVGMVKDEGSGTLVNLKTAAKQLKVSTDFLYRRARSGRLPAYRLGTHWRVNLVELKDWARRSAEGERVGTRGSR